jgi:hypothetical protein
MKKFVAAVLLSAAALYAASSNAFDGTWKADTKKSDYSNNPNGAPREAILTAAENGWTYKSTDATGKKVDLGYNTQSGVLSGDNTITIKYEPSANPLVIDMRVCQKEGGKEVARHLSTLAPDAKSLVIYSSWVGPDGKAFSDAVYFKK